MQNSDFNGLPMPVFTAFGWAGEEAAITYALTQLELFIKRLQRELPRSAQDLLPVAGMSQESQSVYLAMDGDVEKNGFIAFNARPMSLEIQIGVKDKEVLKNAFKLIGQDFVEAHRHIAGLGPEWTLRLQQMQVDEDSGETMHYTDLFNDTMQALTLDVFQEVFSKATYLNGEDQWVTPIFLSARVPSEQVAAMQMKVVSVMSDRIMEALPAFRLMAGQSAKKRVRAKAKRATRTTTTAKPEAITQQLEPVSSGEGFDYVSTLKGLHLRRGFINLTSRHWPFFGVNSRTETRPVTVYYNGIYDKDCTVWRLVPNDQARVVLSGPVHAWMEDEFDENDKVKVQARKVEGDKIQLTLTPA